MSGTVVTVGGQPTWYAEYGDGDPLVYLHGGFSSSREKPALVGEHTVELYRSLPEAEPAVVPGTSHVLVMEKPALVTQLVLDFLTADPVPTIMPIRRA